MSTVLVIVTISVTRTTVLDRLVRAVAGRHVTLVQAAHIVIVALTVIVTARRDRRPDALVNGGVAVL